MLVPLKDQKTGSLEAMMKEFNEFAVAYVFTAFNCDRDLHFVKVEARKQGMSKSIDNAAEDDEWDMTSETNTMGNEKCNILTAYSSQLNENKRANLQDVLPGYFADIMRRTGNNYIELRKALFNIP